MINVVYYMATNPIGLFVTGLAMIVGLMGAFTPGLPTTIQVLGILIYAEVSSPTLVVAVLLSVPTSRKFLREGLGDQYVTNRAGERPVYALIRVFCVFANLLAIDSGAALANTANKSELLRACADIFSEVQTQQYALYMAELQDLCGQMSANDGVDLPQEAPDSGTTHGDKGRAIEQLYQRYNKEAYRARQIYSTMCKDVMQAARDFVPPVAYLAGKLRG